MAKASDNVFPKIIYGVQTSNPAAPTDGSWKTFSKVDGIYARSSNTVVGPFGTGSVGGSGSMVWLQRQTASASATVDFTSFISATYTTYVFELQDILPATDNVSIYLRVGTGGGPTYDSGTNYVWSSYRFSNTGQAGSGGTSATQMGLDGGGLLDNGSTNGLSGTLKLFAPSSAVYKKVTGDFHYLDNAALAPITCLMGGVYVSTTAVTAVRFLASSGNIASGIIDCYGLTHA